jgi:integral membrane sensor domain MASE1
MKYFQGFIIFFFVAIFIALMVIPGDNYYRKKSQRPSVSFETYLIIGIVGGFIGLGVASSWVEQEKKKLEEEEERKRIWKIQEEKRLERIKKSEIFKTTLKE